MRLNLFLLTIFMLSSVFLVAQDNQENDSTWYFVKDELIVNKQSIKSRDVDSIVFYKPSIYKEKFGTLYDFRDGQTYKTVVIGDREWMAENLNYETTSGSWDYLNDPANGEIYGRLYTYNTALVSACPTGWKLPNAEDWFYLENYLIAYGYNWDRTTTSNKLAKSLAAASFNWDLSIAGGTPGQDRENNNSSGFNALPAGIYRSVSNPDNVDYQPTFFEGEGSYTRFWMESIDLAFEIHYNKEYAGNSTTRKEWGASIRCIKDE